MRTRLSSIKKAQIEILLKPTLAKFSGLEFMRSPFAS
jgi:hypothetical protein